MIKRLFCLCAVALAFATGTNLMEPADAQAAGRGQPSDWGNFYYYPYVYYPQNFQKFETYDHLYYRYSPEMQIPVYNQNWHNFYPSERPYHWGHHFILDVF